MNNLLKEKIKWGKIIDKNTIKVECPYCFSKMNVQNLSIEMHDEECIVCFESFIIDYNKIQKQG